MVRLLKQGRGSALVLTILILLVLSALGMVALHDVAQSAEQSGIYRMRVQAQNFADAAADFVSEETGDKARDYWALMQSQHDGDIGQLADDDNMELESRMSSTTRGPYIKLTQRRADAHSGNFPHYFASTADETGLLGGDGEPASFESREARSEFGLVIRDPIEGPTVPGYDDKYCFKKVTIATRGFLGGDSRDWESSMSMAERRSAIETYIGPIECGSR